MTLSSSVALRQCHIWYESLQVMGQQVSHSNWKLFSAEYDVFVSRIKRSLVDDFSCAYIMEKNYIKYKLLLTVIHSYIWNDIQNITKQDNMNWKKTNTCAFLIHFKHVESRLKMLQEQKQSSFVRFLCYTNTQGGTRTHAQRI